jgi:hypothetical protein
VQANLDDDSNTNRGNQRSSKLSVVTLTPLWIAVPLAAVVMEKALEAS